MRSRIGVECLGVVFRIEYSDEGGWVSCRILVVLVLF